MNEIFQVENIQSILANPDVSAVIAEESGAKLMAQVLNSALLGRAKVEEVITYLKTLKSSLPDPSSPVFYSNILESLWALSYSLHDSTSPNFPNLKSLLQELVKKDIISTAQMKETLLETTLKECGIITEIFSRKKNRLNSIYKEENEGWAKLIQELNMQKLTESNVQAVMDNVIELIGYFNIDPNRVLDAVIDAFESDNDNLNFLRLFHLFNQGNIPQVLGFKFKNYLRGTSSGSVEIPPRSLFKVAAQLIKHSIIELDQLWPRLGEDEDDLKKIIQERFSLSEQIYSNGQMAKLGSDAVIEREIEQEKVMMERCTMERRECYKLGLLEELIRVNDMDTVDDVFAHYQYNVDLTMSQGVWKALCELMHWAIENVYAKIRLVRRRQTVDYGFEPWRDIGIKQTETFDELIEETSKILKYLNIYIIHDSLLFQKYIRCLSSSLASPLSPASISTIKSTLKHILLPSLSLLSTPNPQLTHDLWTLLSTHFAFEQRYSMYNTWLTKAYTSCPSMILSLSNCEKEVKLWQKRISKENARQNGRSLARISMTNPLVVFSHIISSMKVYDNQIESCVQALGYCSSLTLDTIVFQLLRHISDGKRSKLDVNDGQIATWLQNLSVFAGLFFKKNHNIDMAGLVYYLCNKLKVGETVELVVLKEILQKMSGWTQLEDMSEDQLQCLAGGFLLRIESAFLRNEFRSSKKSEQSLKKLFWEKTQAKSPEELSLATSLSVLLCQKSRSMLYHTDTDQLKHIASTFDRLQNLLVQLNESLVWASDKQFPISALLPDKPLEYLTKVNMLTPEQAFFIVRPAVGKVVSMETEKWKQWEDSAKGVLDWYVSGLQEAKESEADGSYFTEKEYVISITQPIWHCMTPLLYSAFWYLKLSDVYVPTDRYDAETNKLKAEIGVIQQQGRLETLNNMQKSKNKKEIDKLDKQIKNLINERDELVNNHKAVEKWLSEFKKDLIKESEFTEEIPNVFIQYCLLPRMLFSPQDAMFATKFIVMMQKIHASNFSVLQLLGQLLKSLLPCIRSCTEKESYNVGIFFLELFRTLSEWKKPDIWRRECENTPGFSKIVGSTKSIDIKQFEGAIKEINNKILSSVALYLDSSDYMQARNAVIFLNKLTPVFPQTKEVAEEIEKRIGGLMGRVKHEDLKCMAQAYQSCLKRKLTELKEQGAVGQARNRDYEMSSSFKNTKTSPFRPRSRSKSKERTSRYAPQQGPNKRQKMGDYDPRRPPRR